MPTWPASLPTAPEIGVDDQVDDPVLRTDMDAGPSTRRKRFTAATRSVRVEMHVTGSQRTTLDTFYETTLDYGALTFDWTDLRDDATASYAFKSPPRYIGVRSGDSTTRLWRASFELEVQP